MGKIESKKALQKAGGNQSEDTASKDDDPLGSGKILRPYQVDCLQALTEARQSGSKTGLIVLASGLGKTYVSAMECKNFLEVVEELRAILLASASDDLADEKAESVASHQSGTRVLFLCNREILLVQAMQTFREVFGEGKTYGFFVGRTKSREKVDFLFATFQSMRKHMESFPPGEFNYIVVDEAHHAQANTYRHVMRYFEPDFTLGMTATVHRLDERKLEDVFGEIVFSMDVFEGIAAGWLAQTDYRVVMQDPRRFLKTVKRANFKSVNAVDKTFFVPKRDEKIVRLIKKYANNFRKNARIMIFCKTVEHAERIAELFDQVGVVHSARTTAQNFKTLDEYREGKLKVIVSVQMLNEGLDVPETDVIVFLRNTVSPTVFFQQLGRGLRLCGDKQKVLVLDFVANCERVSMILSILKQVEEYASKFGVMTPLQVKFAAMDELQDVLVESDIRLKTPAKTKKNKTPTKLDIKTPQFDEDVFSLVEFADPKPQKHVLIPKGFIEWLGETIPRLYPKGFIGYSRLTITAAISGDFEGLLVLFGKVQHNSSEVTDEAIKAVVDHALDIYEERLKAH